MINLNNVKIRHKLTVLTMVTSVFSLLLVGVTFIIWGYTSARQNLINQLSTQAKMTADNCEAAVSFDDAQDAENTLKTLQKQPEIVYAGVYTKDRKEFAHYYREDVDAGIRPVIIKESGYSFKDGFLTLYEPIWIDDDIIGYVCLRSEMAALNAIVMRTVTMVALVVFVVSLITWLIASRLQRIISGPILKLTDIAQKVSQEEEYSLRAVKKGHDEVGILIDSFNGMLAKIQQHNMEMTQINQTLEQTVQERTAELTREIAEHQKTEETLRQAKKDAETANQAKSQFLANMSHEIRTPMNAIIGFSELLSDEPLNEAQKEFVKLITKSGNSLLSLINDILDFSKIEARKLSVECVEFSLKDIVLDIESMMRPTATKKNLAFEVLQCGGLPEIMNSDPMRIRQCLINLISNAIKFTSEGHVHVTVSTDNRDGKDFILFDVEDTGIGVKKDTLETIFMEFNQADNSMTRKYGDTGLGLTITKRLAELMGGSLCVASEPCKGSTFTMVIPAGLEVNSAPKMDKYNYVNYFNHTETLKPVETFSGKLLAAEDNPSNQKLITLLVEKMGLEIQVVEDGQKVLEAVSKDHFDIILMDMQMPVMNGFEATRALRKANITTPVIALTANAMLGDDQKCLDAGCNDYLSKPIHREKLLEKIGQYLSPEKVVRIGNDSESSSG